MQPGTARKLHTLIAYKLRSRVCLHQDRMIGMFCSTSFS